MSYKQATVGALLLFLSLVSAQDSAKGAKSISVKHTHRADGLAASPDASNTLFKDNIGNNKANVGVVLDPVANASSAASSNTEHASTKPAYTNSSNFLVTKVSQMLTTIFGNITRHSPGKAVAPPVQKTDGNATSDMPPIDERKRPFKTGKSAGVFGDPKHMRRELPHKSNVLSADRGIPQHRMRTTSKKLHVLPHTRRPKSGPEEA